VRVLDPACGSGNFLYLAILALKDLEYKVNLDAEALGLGRQFPSIGPECVKGIEINPYAAELARVTIWIGEIQWMRRNGFDVERKPILRPLDTIECRDAVMNTDGSEAVWPEATTIIGNQPFLGDRKMIRGLGEEYTEKLRKLYKGRVPGGADLVTYWFEKARKQIEHHGGTRAGLVATNSIRAGANRTVLQRIQDSGEIYEAWSDEPWVVEGAAVRVSLVCFTGGKEAERLSHRLDGSAVEVIYADLTAGKANLLDLTQAEPLEENERVSFIGIQESGPFDISGELARQWLQLPLNPNGRPNTDVIKPLANGIDMVRRPQDMWIIDFGAYMPEAEAALYEKPFEYVENHVKPIREVVRRDAHRRAWWRFGDARPGMRKALQPLTRYILTARVAKHRLFVWANKSILPDSRLYAIAREDDTTFGILHSRVHEAWSLAKCSWHGVGNDPTYNAQSCFETFPFPEGLTPDIPAEQYADDPRGQKIAGAAKRLDELRNNWLNPTDLTMSVPEVVTGYPDRILPKTEAAAAVLKKRTLTNLYNERPAWLENAHRALDEAVADAYGWKADMSDDQMLTKLLALNLERVKASSTG
jgi:type II restriction/modification system DNA methylase subunit YeeA